ncbi:multidrug transporter MatE [Haematobacter missouriensis]|uniref:Multidrug-efflux transporter n=1 Tax=Haematobacter missouriensis TaxID=366616 RepID=A0ABX3ZNI4_9RHOB|nr:MATE family efflux transporter [Haematobacter missouriensis]KFI33986.1 multidrug transporter MatE [Haematobacter missouriensis]OWJ71244.1 MATE family efflux transporter [Haematobacter missouriensis]
MSDRIPILSHVKALLALGIPLIGSNVAQVALHVSNTVMLGWYDVTALAAATLATASYVVLFYFGAGFAQAVMPLVAEAAGTGDETTARRVTRMGMWLSVLYGILLLPVMFWSRPLFGLLGQDPAVSELAQTYLRIVGPAIIPALVVMVLRSYLAALGRTQVVLWVTLTGLAVNIVANWALIFGNWGFPALGIAGAATASALVQLVTMGLLAGYAAWLPELRHNRLFQRIWKPDWQAFGRVFWLGWPIGLTSLAESSLFTAAAVMMGWIGPKPLAAHGIAMELTALAFMLHVGLSNAATVRTGRFLGERNWPELRRGAVVALCLSAICGVGIIVTILTIPGPLIELFLSPSETDREAIIAIGTALLAAAAVFQFGDAAQVMALGLLRGVQDTRVPMFIAGLSYWIVGVPASYLLGFHFGLGPQGIWYGLAVGLILAAILLLLRFWTRALRRE